MSRFAENAARILEAAESSHTGANWSILMSAGGIRMIADCDWPLDSLMWHHGADSVYRVSERSGSIRVEGREGSRSCVLESASPRRIARALLGGSR